MYKNYYVYLIAKRNNTSQNVVPVCFELYSVHYYSNSRRCHFLFNFQSSQRLRKKQIAFPQKTLRFERSGASCIDDNCYFVYTLL